MVKILIKFTKNNRMKFLSHLEILRLMERACRRADIPLCFSQGFNPHPKIEFAAPLSVGVSSDAEYMAIEIGEKMNLDILKELVNDALPTGIKIVQLKYIDKKSKSLMSVISNGGYIVKCHLDKAYSGEELSGKLDKLMAREEVIMRKTNKKGKVKDVNIKELINTAAVLSVVDDELIIKTIVKTGSAGNLKPEEIVKQLKGLEGVEIDLDSIRVHRLEAYTMDKDKMITLYDHYKN